MSTNTEPGMTKSSNVHSSTFIKTATNYRLLYAKNTAYPLMLLADELGNTQL